MARTLKFGGRRRPQPPVALMTLGDVLYRLALIAPDEYRAIDLLARDAYARRWPIDADVVELLRTHDGHR